jgi:mono/diheme cytochrome c family protein
MTKTIRLNMVLPAFVLLACTVSFAQSAGEATYKTKCQSCHGAAGTPNPGIAKLLGIKPVSDPAIKALSLDQVESAAKNGKGKMKPVTGLTDAQIKDVAEYFKSLK